MGGELTWDELVRDLPELASRCVVCDAPAVIRTHAGYRCAECEPAWSNTPEALAAAGAARVRRALRRAVRHAQEHQRPRGKPLGL